MPEQFWDAVGVYVDFTNPVAVRWWKQQITQQLLDLGISATWNDNNEYEIRNPRSLAHGGGNPFAAIEMKPLQTLLMLKASKEAQQEFAPCTPPFLVTRSGCAGMQRYAQTWSGDNRTSWHTLQWNISMGLGLALSGISNIGHDIGGFAGPRPEPELFIRWIGFGVFMPRFSIHSWNDDGSGANEPRMYEELIDMVRQLLCLRLHLRPYLMQLLQRYRDSFDPVVRPPFYDFPDDERLFSPSHDFMLGDAILVAPIVVPGATMREVVLPHGSDWRNAWTGESYIGGDVVSVPAPFDAPPFFLRVNAPLGTPLLAIPLSGKTAFSQSQPFISTLDPLAVDDVACDLQGNILTPNWFTTIALGSHLPANLRVVEVQPLPATVLIGSHSASLTLELVLEATESLTAVIPAARDTPVSEFCRQAMQAVSLQGNRKVTVFLKRICLRDLPKRGMDKWERDVQSYRVEHNFYSHLAPILTSLGVHVPRAFFTQHADKGLEILDTGFLYLLEDLAPTHQPRLHFSRANVAAGLTWAARLHALYWTDAEQAQVVPKPLQGRMWTQGTYWSLSKRPLAEMTSLPSVWREFCHNWRHINASFFDDANILQLGERLSLHASAIDAYLTQHSPRTLIHGDFKGAHLFFPTNSTNDSDALPTVIDWQWSGWSSPLDDIAYFIHSVTALHDLHAGGEAALLQYYVKRLAQAGVKLDLAVAERLYSVAFLNYARIVLAYFYRGVSVADIEREAENITELTHTRSVPHVLHFLSRVDEELAKWERGELQK